ncbi:alanine/glycine:cation symporter family protein [Ammoniphilus sp. 3BR4]|uniref:alanine/glycine:cation symporter family protein n=1 Tax=Ammoniphilus sp. 3BR4 TaxID=3158265 RepID=UPI0034656B72
MELIVNSLKEFVWNPALVYIFLGIGAFYSISTRFVQLRCVKDMIKLTFEGGASNAGVSSFQALSMSLGSRVGTGNIAGVATAIAFGGPGAVFWMWIMSFLGSATSFIEITLTQVYKSNQEGEYRGGPPYYIEKGLKIRWLAVLFAIITMIVMGLLLPGVQANTIALAMDSAFAITPDITGLILVAVLGVIIFGGVKRIAKAAEIVVPFMAIGYVLVCIIVLVLNISQLPSVILLIIESAFGVEATFGGMLGSAISWGVQRGVYSNASGVGSETFESGAAEVSHPAKQGLVQSFSVYIDSLVICSATAFMILLTGIYDVKPEGQEAIVNKLGDIEPSLYTQLAVESVLPSFGAPFLAIALLFFCFTTLMSYYYKAETSLAFINRNRNIKLVWPKFALKIVLLFATYLGSVKTAKLAWAMGDLGLGSMAWLNMITILLLTRTALKVLRDYERQRKEGKDPVFDPVKLGIEGADFWEKEYKEYPVENFKENQRKPKSISS